MISGYGRLQGYGFCDKEDFGTFGTDSRARGGGALQHGPGEVGREKSARGTFCLPLSDYAIFYTIYNFVDCR